MYIVMWNVGLTLINWNQYQARKPLEHLMLVLIVFFININGLFMSEKNLHHKFGLNSPHYIFLLHFPFQNKGKYLITNFHYIHGSFICNAIFQGNLLDTN